MARGESPGPRLAPSLLMEADYRRFGAQEEGLSGFALARLRPGLALSLGPWLRGRAVVEFAGGGPSVLDAAVELWPAEALSVTLGYSKPPLVGLFFWEPVSTQAFPDRAPVEVSFRVRRDAGAGLTWRPRALPVEAALRVSNGSGSAQGNDNDALAWSGLADLVLGRARRGGESELYGLRVGVSGMWEEVEEREGISGRLPTGFVYARPAPVVGRRAVGDAHAQAYAGPVRVTLQGAASREERSRDTDGNPATARAAQPEVSAYGYSAELSWALWGEPRRPGRGPSPLLEAPEGAGALEVSARFDRLWLNRAEDLERNGGAGGALSLRWWWTESFALTLAGYLTRYDVAPIERPGEERSWLVLTRASVILSP